jgi:hypothetical protein
MRLLIAAVAITGLAAFAQNQAPVPDPDRHYRIGPDSLPQEGVPKGEIRGPFTLPSQAYPGTQHVLGLRTRAIQRVGSGEPDDLQ